MKISGDHNYFVYITTNFKKTVLYIGMTNNLMRRLYEHKEDSKTTKRHFAGKYGVVYLVYWEIHQQVEHGIEREKQIKGWVRAKKIALIEGFNPDWRFLNNEVE